ncbi:SAM-dependent methyltransferase [Phaeobacter inhibens]|uniref:SAM-dependent methyltransferase n=1 Tax=Phaeobacter inhibens TaxID=221822 RepID=UPI0021A2EC2D|nr:SAM-dependent methyltransferase [Phaeobacter inhibens]UWR62790.1 SAM-dependent methyltransferase [Phaeobacter inhibens]
MNPAVKEFVRLLNDIDRSKHRSEVFADFCEMSYCALAKKASPFPDQRETLEAQYMSVVARYRNKDDVRKMPEMVGIALGEIGNGGCDFLGMAAGELEVLDAKLGQFFTPYEVSRMMAEISLTDVDEKIAEQGFITVQEPAAGAGGMLLAVADVIEGKGLNLETSIWIEAVELSRPTYHMCYVQCAARGLAGKIICGNSLSLEVFTGAYTAAASVFFAANGDPFAKQKEQAKQAAAQEAKREEQAESERKDRLATLGDGPVISGQQLTLF